MWHIATTIEVSMTQPSSGKYIYLLAAGKPTEYCQRLKYEYEY